MVSQLQQGKARIHPDWIERNINHKLTTQEAIEEVIYFKIWTSLITAHSVFFSAWSMIIPQFEGNTAAIDKRQQSDWATKLERMSTIADNISRQMEMSSDLHQHSCRHKGAICRYSTPLWVSPWYCGLFVVVHLLVHCCGFLLLLYTLFTDQCTKCTNEDHVYMSEKRMFEKMHCGQSEN